MRNHALAPVRSALGPAACLCVGLAGLAGAAVPLVRPLPQSPALGVILPPFGADHAMDAILATGLPVADIRLGGRLVVVMADPAGHGLAALGQAGLAVISVTPPPSCQEEPS